MEFTTNLLWITANINVIEKYNLTLSIITTTLIITTIE